MPRTKARGNALLPPRRTTRARRNASGSEDNPALHAIWDVVAQIPRSSVWTYGDVAREAGLPGRARQAGYALKQSSSAELINAIRTVASGRPYLDPELNHGLMGLFVQGRTFRKPPDLTPRETEVLRLTAWGHSNKEIASQLGLSVKTVEVHKTNGMRKLGMNSRLQLVRYALLRNWFQDT